MEKYTKLVRDRIPEIMDKAGVPYTTEIAVTPEEKEEWLLKKLQEELAELLEAKNVEELADVLEVIAELRKSPKYANVEDVRQGKFIERGGFEKGIIMTGEKYK
jgi:predicted house-cleaning noncanonical NTP pyrophosphatase (MazG superfamily)